MAPDNSDRCVGQCVAHDAEQKGRERGHAGTADGRPGGRASAGSVGRPGECTSAATAPPDRPHALVADEPRTPRRIALVAASAGAGLGFLLDDVRAAYGAYSRLAGCELPEFAPAELGESGISAVGAVMGAPRPRAVEPASDAASELAGAAGRALSERAGAAGADVAEPRQDAGEAADSVVFACDGAIDAEELDSLSNLLGTGSRLHAIFDLPGLDPALADDAAHMLIDLCEQNGALWCGGVALAGGRPFDLLRCSPRMGLLRRPFSEAMDMLVGSVRMGCSVRRSQELGGADVNRFDALGLVRATPALPPSLWSLVMRALGKVR